MMTDAKPNPQKKVTSAHAYLDETHPADGSEAVWNIDTRGLGGGVMHLTILSPSGSTVWSVEEGPAAYAPDAHFEEIDSGTALADSLTPVRHSLVMGGCIRIKATASVAARLIAIVH
jgi:hypothetical protein